jgi:hypothetical protein
MHIPEVSVRLLPSRLDYEYDPRIDVITIEGVRYSGDFFRLFAAPPAGVHLVVERRDGMITITEHRECTGGPA